MHGDQPEQTLAVRDQCTSEFWLKTSTLDTQAAPERKREEVAWSLAIVMQPFVSNGVSIQLPFLHVVQELINTFLEVLQKAQYIVYHLSDKKSIT